MSQLWNTQWDRSTERPCSISVCGAGGIWKVVIHGFTGVRYSFIIIHHDANNTKFLEFSQTIGIRQNWCQKWDAGMNDLHNNESLLWRTPAFSCWKTPGQYGVDVDVVSEMMWPRIPWSSHLLVLTDCWRPILRRSSSSMNRVEYRLEFLYGVMFIWCWIIEDPSFRWSSLLSPPQFQLEL